MRISVIGAGSVGGTLALRWAERGHVVRLANSRGPESLADLVAGTSVSAVPLGEVTHGVEAVVLSIPFGAVRALAAMVGAIPSDVVVLDTGNYVPTLRDDPIAAIEDGQVESRWVGETLGRPVVKAFNTVGAGSLRDRARPAGDPGRVAVPIAAETDHEQVVAARLVNDAGFDPVASGRLDDSWRQQPGTPIYTTDLNASAVPAALAEARPEQTVAWRAKMAALRR